MVWRMDPSKKDIYLTFDDGPIPGVTPWVLDTLKQFNSKATFFCVGDNVQKHSGIYKQIIADGHTAANHTFNHLNGWNTHTTTYLKNVLKCAEVVDSKLFRPPYGRIKKSQSAILNHQFSIVMWDVLSGDFDRSITPGQCLKNVIDFTREGSIVVFHDSEKAKENLFHALPQVLEYFQKKGFDFKALTA